MPPTSRPCTCALWPGAIHPGHVSGEGCATGAGVTGVAYHGPAAAGFVRIGGSVASDGGTLYGTTGSSRKAIPSGKCTGLVGNPTASWASPKPQPRASTNS